MGEACSLGRARNLNPTAAMRTCLPARSSGAERMCGKILERACPFCWFGLETCSELKRVRRTCLLARSSGVPGIWFVLVLCSMGQTSMLRSQMPDERSIVTTPGQHLRSPYLLSHILLSLQRPGAADASTCNHPQPLIPFTLPVPNTLTACSGQELLMMLRGLNLGGFSGGM